MEKKRNEKKKKARKPLKIKINNLIDVCIYTKDL